MRNREPGLPGARWRDLTVAHEVAPRLAEIERDATLSDERPGPGFDARLRVLDWLHFETLDRLRCALAERQRTPLPTGEDDAPELARLLAQAQHLEARLEAVNERIWERLRAGMRTGSMDPAELRAWFDGYTSALSSREGLHYDVADAFALGLLRLPAPPDPTLAREPEMVYYQPTPVRFILRLIDRAHIGPGDVFYDLGSGLGQVVILVRALSGARSVGIEFEPEYVAAARRLAAELGLDDVTFVNADARHASLAAGSVYFLYTPFQGHILRQVLERLAHEAETRAIRIATFGPCTELVAREPWLRPWDDKPRSEEGLAIFTRN